MSLRSFESFIDSGILKKSLAPYPSPCSNIYYVIFGPKFLSKWSISAKVVALYGGRISNFLISSSINDFVSEDENSAGS